VVKICGVFKKTRFVTLTKKEATLFATYALQLVGEMKDMKEKKGKAVTDKLEGFKITSHQLRVLISIKILLLRNETTTGKAVSKLIKTSPQQARGLMHVLELKNMIKARTKVGGKTNAWNFTPTPLGELVLKQNVDRLTSGH
jgi:hypothetical protein